MGMRVLPHVQASAEILAASLIHAIHLQDVVAPADMWPAPKRQGLVGEATLSSIGSTEHRTLWAGSHLGTHQHL
jgi:hypothetical protein